MAKSTKINELAGSLSIGKQELVELINKSGLGFTVKTTSSSVNEEQEKAIRAMFEKKRQAQCASAIDEKSQSTARTNGVRVRRKTVDDVKPEPQSSTSGFNKKTDSSSKTDTKSALNTKITTAKTEVAADAKTPDQESSNKTSAPSASKPTTTDVPTTNAPKEAELKVDNTPKENNTATTDASQTAKLNAEPTQTEQNTENTLVTSAKSLKSNQIPAESQTPAPSTVNEVTTQETPHNETPTSEIQAQETTTQAHQDVPQTPVKDTDSKTNDNTQTPVDNTAKLTSLNKTGQKSKDDKKKNRSNKKDKSLDQFFSLQPKFEKDDVSVAINPNVIIKEELVTVVVEDDDDELEIAVTTKKKSKPRTKIAGDEALENARSNAEFGYHANESKKSKPNSNQPSNIKGFIDPEEIKRRLAKDNKTFGAEQPAKEKSTSKTPARKVVNQKDLYNNSNNSGNAAFSQNKKGQKPQKGVRPAAPEKPVHTIAAEHKRVIRISEVISISDLARDMGVKAADIIRFLMTNMGTMMTVNQTLDVETAEIVASEFGYTVQDVTFKEESFTGSKADRPEDLVLRAPVVTVMGHVDHGKTSLLDAIRNSRVTASEAGGITQHIGASTIDTSNGKVVFLDTPGHEAFTALRARGAKVTDLVVLVVAADDGVMPQTVEAINHAKAANVPIIVAINKIDKNGANPERVKQALTEYELVSEEWGGSTIFKEVSALTGEGIADLLELIYLQSEILELKANPNKEARGIVLEAYKDNRRGTVASLIVQEGTLHASDIIVTGATFGKIKSMVNDKGKPIRVAPPSTPVEIIGLPDVPEAGEPFFVTKDEKIAKQFTEEIKMRKRNDELKAKKFDPWAAFKENKQLNVIIKTDVQGTLEALEKSLSCLSTNDVELCIVHAAVGCATESDVQLAIASDALIIGFNTRPEARAMEIAKREGVIIETFSVIYDVIDKVKEAMSGLLDPVFKDNILGHAEVRNTFNVPKIGTIAGCYVTDGIIKRNARVKLLRNGKIIYDSKIASLKRFKDDAKEVRNGFECGLSIDNYNDVKVGDIIETYEIQELKQSI